MFFLLGLLPVIAVPIGVTWLGAMIYRMLLLQLTLME
jgi:hypothetical protein